MEPLVIQVDFTGTTPHLGSGVAYLPADGFYTGDIADFKIYPARDNTDTLYAYYVTTLPDGSTVRHRDKFQYKKGGKPFFQAMLISAGVDPGGLSKKVKIPLHKLAGKSLYFQYSRPEFNADGTKKDNSWPRYRYFTEKQYTAVATPPKPVAEAVEAEADDLLSGVDDVVEAEAANPVAPVVEDTPTSAEVAADDDDNLSFLTDDL